MIVWSGWGLLVLPVVFLTVLVADPVTRAVLDAVGRADLRFLAAAATWLAAAGANWWVGRWLNGGPVFTDPATGRAVTVRARHRLFWMPMEYWSVPLLLMAALALVLPLLGTP